jgi:hypothetical protein
MRALILVILATLLLAVAFFAFFPQESLVLLGDVGGPRTVGLKMDDTATHVLWVIGGASLVAAISAYMKAFT